MTKKDYELIAEMFAKHRRSYGGRTDSVTLELINDLADALQEDNPKFDRDKFLTACGIGHTHTVDCTIGNGSLCPDKIKQ